MQLLAVRILCVALIAVYGGVSSVTAVETKRPDDRFAPRFDRIQGLLDYIHTAKKIKVKAGPTLWQAIEAIPVATGGGDGARIRADHLRGVGAAPARQRRKVSVHARLSVRRLAYSPRGMRK